jgi:hypothetical protein
MSLPNGQKPSLLENPDFHKIIFKKSLDKHAEKYLLGLVGTMKLSGLPIEDYFISTLDSINAKRFCQQSSDSDEITLFRLIAGLWAIAEYAITNPEKAVYLRALHKLNRKLTLNVPKQQLVMNKLERWLSGAFVKKRKG